MITTDLHDKFWDIFLSERWNIPPWEVRDKATNADIVRLRLLDNIKSQGRKAHDYITEQKMKLEQKYSKSRR